MVLEEVLTEGRMSEVASRRSSASFLVLFNQVGDLRLWFLERSIDLVNQLKGEAIKCN